MDNKDVNVHTRRTVLDSCMYAYIIIRQTCTSMYLHMEYCSNSHYNYASTAPPSLVSGFHNYLRDVVAKVEAQSE